MRRLGADQPYMNQETRDSVLAQIAIGRAQQTRVQDLLNTLPAWSDRPFKNDQENFDAAYKSFRAADPLVSAVETRLMTEPGPVWRDFSPEERTAFTNWTTSLDKLEGYVNSYFPTEQQQRIMEYILWGIALGSFVLPMLLTEDSKVGLPFKLEPFPLPPGMKPRIPPPAGATAPRTVFKPTMLPQGRASFSPTSFSKIPTASSGAIPVKAEVMRPATAAAPWRSSIPAPTAGGLPTPGFRSFVKPLGPSAPATTAQATAAGAPVSPATESHNPRIYPKPRFRSQ